MRNSASFIMDSIDSIIEQSYQNWELIIVDDHSIDESTEIVKFYQSQHPNIHLLQNVEKGIIPALCLALEKSSGNFITRMDSDDKMPSNRLEIMLKKWYDSDKAKKLVTGLVNYFGDSVSEAYRNYETWLNQINLEAKQWQNIYRECVIASPNWLIQKTDLVEAGGFKNLKYPEDYHLVLRWYHNKFEILFCNEITLLWREHPERTSRNSENYQQQAFFKLKISFFLQNEFKGENLLLWGTGKKARLTAAILINHNVDFYWMDLNPNQFPDGIQGQTIHDFQKTKIFKAFETQILLGVYPSEEEKNKIEAYLESLNFLIGKNYWYL